MNIGPIPYWWLVCGDPFSFLQYDKNKKTQPGGFSHCSHRFRLTSLRFSILRASSQDSPGGPSFIEGFLAAECVDANGEWSQSAWTEQKQWKGPFLATGGMLDVGKLNPLNALCQSLVNPAYQKKTLRLKLSRSWLFKGNLCCHTGGGLATDTWAECTITVNQKPHTVECFFAIATTYSWYLLRFLQHVVHFS